MEQVNHFSSACAGEIVWATLLIEEHIRDMTLDKLVRNQFWAGPTLHYGRPSVATDLNKFTGQCSAMSQLARWLKQEKQESASSSGARRGYASRRHITKSLLSLKITRSAVWHDSHVHTCVSACTFWARA